MDGSSQQFLSHNHLALRPKLHAFIPARILLLELLDRHHLLAMGGTHVSEVSKRGWRTEGVATVVAKKSFLCQRLRPLLCTLFLCPLRRRGTHYWRIFFGCFWRVVLSPTPSRQPLFETSVGTPRLLQEGSRGLLVRPRCSKGR